MAYKLNRIYSGLFILIILCFFYLSSLDFLLLFIFSALMIYEIYINKLYSIKSIIFLISFFIIFIIFLNYFIYISNFFKLLSIILIISLSIFYYNFFIFFNLILLFFIFSSYELLLNERSLFYIIILASFINDSTAYIFGNLLKGPQIIPSISPNKTYSGTIISSLISFSFLFFYLKFSLVFSFFIAILFFLGDIYFSYIKRKNNIKDFSNIIPGHGGLFDRIDSFLFPIILVNLYLA